MTFHWLWLLLALLLLWSPPMVTKAVSRRLERRPWLKPARIMELLAYWPNWLDLLRASVGPYILTALAIKTEPAVKGAETQAFLIRGVVLGIGVIVQTVRFQKKIIFLAPVFYLTGLTLALSGLAGLSNSGFAVFVGWLFATAGKNPIYLLPVFGTALGVGGYVLQGLNLPLMLNCALIFFPLIISLAFRRPLTFMAPQS